MATYYYAVDHLNKKYFSAPGNHGIKYPSVFHPNNPFPGMLVMMNCKGYFFEVLGDCSNDIPPEDDFEDITEKVYADYLKEFEVEIVKNG